jgi:hypothetical protein
MSTSEYGSKKPTGWSQSLCAPDDYNTESYNTLMPSIISNSNYVIMVDVWNRLKYCIFACFVL